MKTMREEQVVLLVDGAAGIYCAQHTAEAINLTEWDIAIEDVEILKAGPHENDLYDEVWASALDNAEKKGEDGHTWHLHQAQDVWMFRDDTPDSWFN